MHINETPSKWHGVIGMYGVNRIGINNQYGENVISGVSSAAASQRNGMA